MKLRGGSSMTDLTFRFREDEIIGTISINALHDAKYYDRYHLDWTGINSLGKQTCLQKLRYVNWSDHTGFVRSSSYQLRCICRKRRRSYFQNPQGFDHTTYWCRPGEKFPLFCLTEPYDYKHQNFDFEKAKKTWLIDYKIFKPSSKSLWFPNSTYMIFFWCPAIFNFESYEDLLMSHEDSEVFEKRCLIDEKERKPIRTKKINL